MVRCLHQWAVVSFHLFPVFEHKVTSQGICCESARGGRTADKVQLREALTHHGLSGQPCCAVHPHLTIPQDLLMKLSPKFTAIILWQEFVQCNNSSLVRKALLVYTFNKGILELG